MKYSRLDPREERLVKNCVRYAEGDPAGLPGHNILLIVAKQHWHIQQLQGQVEEWMGRSLFAANLLWSKGMDSRFILHDDYHELTDRIPQEVMEWLGAAELGYHPAPAEGSAHEE